jgi:hypothetical protein
MREEKMGVAEIIGFAICWLLVASLMLWGVFTEHKRGGTRLDATTPPVHPSRFSRTAQTDWIVVETCQGGTTDVAAQTRLIASALLASRGIDIESLPPADIRTEVTSTEDGTATTRLLVRAGAMHASRRHT